MSIVYEGNIWQLKDKTNELHTGLLDVEQPRTSGRTSRRKAPLRQPIFLALKY